MSLKRKGSAGTVSAAPAVFHGAEVARAFYAQVGPIVEPNEHIRALTTSESRVSKAVSDYVTSIGGPSALREFITTSASTDDVEVLVDCFLDVTRRSRSIADDMNAEGEESSAHAEPPAKAQKLDAHSSLLDVSSQDDSSPNGSSQEHSSSSSSQNQNSSSSSQSLPWQEAALSLPFYYCPWEVTYDAVDGDQQYAENGEAVWRRRILSDFLGAIPTDDGGTELCVDFMLRDRQCARASCPYLHDWDGFPWLQTTEVCQRQPREGDISIQPVEGGGFKLEYEKWQRQSDQDSSSSQEAEQEPEGSGEGSSSSSPIERNDLSSIDKGGLKRIRKEHPPIDGVGPCYFHFSRGAMCRNGESCAFHHGL